MRGALLFLTLVAATAWGDSRVTIEKATVPWDELVRLIREEGRPAPVYVAPSRNAPVPWSLRSVDISGEVKDGIAELQLTIVAEVLDDRWTMVPLLPDTFAISDASVRGPYGRRGILVRNGGVALAAEGAGRYELTLSVEGTLDDMGEGQRLSLPLREIAFGAARINVPSVTKVSGASPWKLRRSGKTMIAEAALGGRGLELILPTRPARQSGAGALEDLTAVTVVSLGGSGVGRLRVSATPNESGVLEVELPKGARAWKVYVGNTPLPASFVRDAASTLRIPLKTAAAVEIAWTFEMPPLGIRGRYRLELPKLPMPVRGARWSVYLPAGLTYSETQAALSPSPECHDDDDAALTTLEPSGVCAEYARAVLDSGRAWLEGHYSQAL